MSGSSRVWRKLEQGLYCSLVLVMFLAVVLSIVSRYLFHSPVFFAEEVALIAYVWLSFLGMSYATRTGAHIQMNLFHDHISPRARDVLDGIVLLISLIVMIALLVVLIGFLSFDRYAKTAALRISRSVLNLALLIGVVTNIISLLRAGWVLLRRRKDTQ